jgi:Dolichyl-phosphate-mannose-protein mannosyltransferase
MARNLLRKRQILMLSGATILIAIFAFQLLSAARQQSISWDEDDHIYAGYMSWMHGDFGLNPEHPPLLKLVATLPILHMPLQVPALQNRFFKLDAFLGGKDFVFKNDAETILSRVHVAASVFALCLLALAFAAANEMFGAGAAFITLGLLAFDPNLLAHGAMVATDTALSCVLFATIYAFYRYVKHPRTARLIVTGGAAGLALATKHSAILLLPMAVMLAVCELVRERHGAPTDAAPAPPSPTLRAHALRLTFAIVAISAIGVAVLWASHGFRYAARPAGLQLNPTLAEFIPQLSRRHDAALISFFARWHLLPESYLYGLVDVRNMSDFYPTYLLGKPYPHGVWYYFPVVFLIKSTVGFLALLLVAVGALIKRKVVISREVLFLTIPPVFYFVVAMASGMNIGLRHILPLYAFLAVLIGGVGWMLIRQRKMWAYVVACLAFLHIASAAHSYPDYIPYANELWGGPSQTYRLLSDSNVDWGQQLKFTSKYLKDRGIKDCWFVYFAEGVVDTHYYGIPCKPLPTADSLWVNENMDVPEAIDGPVLISAGDLSAAEFGPGVSLNPYDQFILMRPAAVIQNAVFVYEGHFEIPLAAALIHVQKAGNLLAESKLDEARAEAQKAVSLAPDAVSPHATLGDVLTAMKRGGEARVHYQRALELARTVKPDFQIGWREPLERKLRSARR